MIEHTYQVLEYHRFLDILSRYASCPLGRSECLSLTPSNDIQGIGRELSLVSEARLLLKLKGLLSFGDLTDVTPLLGMARVKGACLQAEDLLTILRLAESAQAVRGFLRSDRPLYPGLAGIMDDMPDLASLAGELKGAISPAGEIRDDATPRLAGIREQRRRQRVFLEKKLNDIRMSKGLGRGTDERLVTVRDGRYVISVRSDQKSLLGGIVHDYSRSRSTCFVEPVEVIDDNNRSAELALEEKGEERRILLRLTGRVREMTPQITHAQGLIGRLDCLFARARYGEESSCVPPEIVETGDIRLRGARNPILLALSRAQGKGLIQGPVAVDITLRIDRNLLVISGPNRGGKTVTLKTLGLLILMTQAGLHIPAAEGTSLPVFDRVMADIGDDQDIQTGLSTFSAHAENLKRIVEEAGPKGLVIIDEPGMGTDPNEGAALTMAVLDDLSQKGAFVALATHLNRLKAYGLSNPRVLNAAVEFDPACNRPTFRLRYGSPGISHALETARELGMPVGILERAQGYLDQDEVHLNRLIEKMHRLTVEVEEARREAEAAKQAHDAAVEDLRAQSIRMEGEKRAFMEGYREEAEKAIRSASEELKQAINLLKRNKRDAQADVTKRFGAVARELCGRFNPANEARSTTTIEEWKAGQRVFHTRLKQHGVIESVDVAGGRGVFTLGSLKVSAALKDLEIVTGSETGGGRLPSRPASRIEGKMAQWKSGSAGFPPGELNVVGYHVDEAIPLIDRAVDRALVEGRMTITIIHGHGTGRLRGAIRDHLRENPFVKAVTSADPMAGGDAVTVAELG